MELSGSLQYWQAPQRALPAENLVEKPLAGIESEESGAETSTNGLLFDILRMLQRVDARMEGQDMRLGTLETSIQSQEFHGARSHWPAFGVAQSSQPRIGQEPANEYEASVMKMKMKYEFDASVSCLETDASEIETTAASKNNEVRNNSPECLDLGKGDTDAYSISVYTGDMLNSRAIRVPESHVFDNSQLSDIPRSLNSIHDADDTPNMSSNDVASRSSSDNSWKTSSSGRSKAPHERVELAFQAYDNWKQGVLSRIKNDARTAQDKEMKRLRMLQPSCETVRWQLWKLSFSIAEKAVMSIGSALLFSREVGRDRSVTVVF
jgi:hypothetical protein